MRHSTRFWIIIASALTCLLLCAAFIGNAFASGGPKVHPRITVTPHQIFTDINGCGSVRVSGTGYSPTTQTAPNEAMLELSDSEGNAYFQNGIIFPNTLFVPVDAKGRFSAVVTICDPLIVPGDTFTICTTDADTGIDGNCVNVRAS